MSADLRPVLVVKRCAGLDLDSWENIAAAFADAPCVESRQAWRETPEPEFRPMRVQAKWDAEALYVHAVLDDDDIFNPETRFNALAFQCGDVFEIFLRPAGQDAYFEFHVTPENNRFQLRIPSAAAFATTNLSAGIPAEWFIRDRVLASRVRVDAAAGRWEVAAKIPFDWVCEEAPPPKPNDRWLFSFSRYDYTRGRPAPVLSSTSPHQKVSFHRQQEWGQLEFR